MERKIELQFPIKGKDFKNVGSVTIKTKKLLEAVLKNDECFKTTSFHNNRDFLRRFSVCMYEAEANVIIHAYYGIAKTVLRCTKIEGEVVDRGPGIPSMLNALTPGFSTAPEAAKALGFGAGIGLNNIQKMADVTIIYTEVGIGTLLQFEVWKEETAKKRSVEMKIKQIIKDLKLEVVTKNIDMEKEIECAYACDLLSNVLAKAKSNSAWLTIQTNINIIGVATIKSIPIIIISEDSNIPQQTIKKAEENGIILAKGKEDTFVLSGKLYELFNKDGM